MPQRHRDAYPPEFKSKLVALVLAGSSPEELAREFEPSNITIRNWVKQSQLDSGSRKDGLTSDDQAETARLRKRVKQLEWNVKSSQKQRPDMFTLGRGEPANHGLVHPPRP